MWIRRLALATLAWASCTLAAPADPPKATEPGTKPLATVAHIKLSGSPDEAPVSEESLFGAAAENFKAKLARIHKAQQDSAVKALYLHLDDLAIGWGKLDELSRAIADFRAAGKKAIAYLESGSSKDYLVALAWYQVLVPEAGWLMLTGLRAEATFYKELFDKIGVKADMLQMGAFKGAAEPFTRTKLSKENREQMESILDDYYDNSVVGRIVAARKGKQWKPEHVRKLIDQGP